MSKFVDVTSDISITTAYSPNGSDIHTIALPILVTCEADNIQNVECLLDDKIKKIKFYLALFNTNFMVEHISKVYEIDQLPNLFDFAQLEKFLTNTNSGTLEETAFNAINNLLYATSDIEKFFTSFAKIVNILDKLKGRNTSNLCSLRNLIQHVGENQTNFTINLQKSQELGLDLQTNDGILIPNRHNVDELSKKKSQLLQELRDYYEQTFNL